jgi:hypothetical protein
MTEYAYMLNDNSRPPRLYEVHGVDPETDLVILSPADNPQQVLYVYEDDIWQLT